MHDKLKMVLYCPVLLLLVMGCSTVTHSGATAAMNSYTADEPGKHWVRPREVSYEISNDIIIYTLKIDPKLVNLGETVVFGYPAPGNQADPYVSFAAAQLVFTRKVDGVLITSYKVVHNPQTNMVDVNLQGRLITMKDLGIVDADRADKERFPIMFEKSDEGGTTRYSAPVGTGNGPSVSRQVRSSTSGSTGFAFGINAGIYAYNMEFDEPYPAGDISFSYYVGDSFAIGLFGGYPSVGAIFTIGDTKAFAVGIKGGYDYDDETGIIGGRFHLANISFGADYSIGDDSLTITGGYTFRF